MARLIIIRKQIYHYYLISVLIFCSYAAQAEGYDFKQIQQRVNAAIQEKSEWQGPLSGPIINSDKQIVFIASDLRNDGVSSVAKGMSDAISELDWQLRLLDGNGSKIRQAAILNRAIAMQPDGIVLGGIDAKHHRQALNIAKQLGIAVIGWHAANHVGEHQELGLFTNITTNAQKVGEIAASLAIVDAKGKAKVVIFTDSNYSIATLKANSMARAIEECPQCELVCIEDIPLDNIANELPATISRLLENNPNQITHFLAINDLYIDFAIPTLQALAMEYDHIPQNISAGDGSFEAYNRIGSHFFQLATVPEPLFMQGWQIIDELNRAFHQLPPSGYEAPVHLTVKSNVHTIDQSIGVYDPKNKYRENYMRIWK